MRWLRPHPGLKGRYGYFRALVEARGYGFIGAGPCEHALTPERWEVRISIPAPTPWDRNPTLCVRGAEDLDEQLRNIERTLQAQVVEDALREMP